MRSAIITRATNAATRTKPGSAGSAAGPPIREPLSARPRREGRRVSEATEKSNCAEERVFIALGFLEKRSPPPNRGSECARHRKAQPRGRWRRAAQCRRVTRVEKTLRQ